MISDTTSPTSTSDTVETTPFENMLPPTPPEPAQPSAPQAPLPTTGRRRSAGKIFAVIFVLLAAGGVGAWWWRNEQIRKWKWEAIAMSERVARVPKEWSATDLADRLAENRRIRDRDTFLEAATQVGLKRVTPGGYVLPPKAGPLELAKIFRAPAALQKVTFPEGWTGARIAARLEKRGFGGAVPLRRLIYPSNAPVSLLEGRLFPETYWLPHRGSAQQLAAKLNDRFQTVAKGLPRPFPVGYKEKRLTLSEVVTLASIVERETSVPDERPLVAGVLLNRLRKGMRLQCDATVQYALERAQANGQLPTGRKSRLSFRDIAAVKLSPYNTYKIPALPPGPICNPGEAALFAAARPKPSKYFFYVWSPRLSHHRFAIDFKGHGHNIKLYKQELGD